MYVVKILTFTIVIGLLMEISFSSILFLEKGAGIFWMATDFWSLLSHFSSNLIDFLVCQQDLVLDHDKLKKSSPRSQERPLSFLSGHGGDCELPDQLGS